MNSFSLLFLANFQTNLSWHQLNEKLVNYKLCKTLKNCCKYECILGFLIFMRRSFTACQLLMKIGIVSVTLVRLFKYDKRRSVSAGLSMAQISEAGLVVLARASRLGFIQRSTYLTLVPTTCILLALVPFSGNYL